MNSVATPLAGLNIMPDRTSTCTTCAQMKLSEETDEEEAGLHHQTFQQLEAAAHQGCFICHKIWEMMHKSGDEASSLASMWNPMSYCLSNDMAGRQLYHLNISFDTPISSTQLEVVNFRIVPHEDVSLKAIRGDTTGINDKQTQEKSHDMIQEGSLPGSLSEAQLWLQDCQNNHTMCGTTRKRDEGWCPTRVIDIGLANSAIWKLECTFEHVDRRPFELYMALSYRWGRNPALLLLHRTIDDFRCGQPIDKLPKTFRDVVQVAKHFNVRYLWIDALCIIQDSAEDWNKEALKMHQVYANSLCTISATASTDENDGLFRHLDSTEIKPGIMELPLLSGTHNFYVYEREYWQNHISQGPLHNRGWVFQERHLSPRVLYFGKQVLWECLQAARCEAFPDGMPHHVSEKSLDELLHQRAVKRNKTSRSLPGMTRGVHYLWRNLVRNYVLCSFTKIEDKLIAFAGIAHIFYEATGDQYLAGLWRSHLKEGLDWRVYEPVAKLSSYRAPSWSWASIDGPARPELSTSYSKYPIEILDAKVMLEGTNPMSKVVDGYLIVTALLLEGYCEPVLADGRNILRIGSHSAKVRLYPDIAGREYLGNHKVYMFPLHSFLLQTSPKPGDVVAHVVFIWLERSAKNQAQVQNTYSRIGHFIVNDKDFLTRLGLSPDDHGVMIPDQAGRFSIFKFQ